jgi:hypothetical protein
MVLDVTFNEALPSLDVVRELFVREGVSFAAERVAYDLLCGTGAKTKTTTTALDLV